MMKERTLQKMTKLKCCCRCYRASLHVLFFVPLGLPNNPTFCPAAATLSWRIVPLKSWPCHSLPVIALLVSPMFSFGWTTKGWAFCAQLACQRLQLLTLAVHLQWSSLPLLGTWQTFSRTCPSAIVLASKRKQWKMMDITWKSWKHI